MTLRVTPWGKDDFKATSEEAESKDWAYWQNRLNRASLVMLAEEGIIDKNIVPRIAAAQKHAEDLQNLPGAPRLTDIMPLEKMLIESCGEEATLIHTGRSRQDMFTTLNEARLRLAVLDFYEALNKLRTRLLSIARENIETYIPSCKLWARKKDVCIAPTTSLAVPRVLLRMPGLRFCGIAEEP